MKKKLKKYQKAGEVETKYPNPRFIVHPEEKKKTNLKKYTESYNQAQDKYKYTPAPLATGAVYDPTNEWAMEAIYATAPIPFLSAASKAAKAKALKKVNPAMGNKAGNIEDLSTANRRFQVGDRTGFNPDHPDFTPYAAGERNQGIKDISLPGGVKDQAWHDWINSQKIQAVHGEQPLLKDAYNPQQYAQYNPFMSQQVANRGPMREFRESPKSKLDETLPPMLKRSYMEAGMREPAANINPKGLILPHSIFPYDYLPHAEGGAIQDNMGQWAHPGEVTKINSNHITMKGVSYPVLGKSDRPPVHELLGSNATLDFGRSSCSWGHRSRHC